MACETRIPKLTLMYNEYSRVTLLRFVEYKRKCILDERFISVRHTDSSLTTTYVESNRILSWHKLYFIFTIHMLFGIFSCQNLIKHPWDRIFSFSCVPVNKRRELYLCIPTPSPHDYNMVLLNPVCLQIVQICADAEDMILPIISLDTLSSYIVLSVPHSCLFFDKLYAQSN